MNEDAAIQWVRGTIRARMVQLGLSYADLTEALRHDFNLEGDEWNEKNIANRVARGTFSAVFFVQCLEAMGVENLPLAMRDHMYIRGTGTIKDDAPDELALHESRRQISKVRWMTGQPEWPFKKK